MEKNIVLIAVNSKYIHSNLALRYIKKYVEYYSDNKINIREWTINNKIDDIIKDIYLLKPEILGFSVYIWNKEYIFKIACEIKKILPNVKIIFGGPEVSYNAIEIMKKNKSVDFIIKGEGERNFLEFIQHGAEITKGIYYRESEDIKYNGDNELEMNLDKIPFPYEEKDLEELKNRIIYYESSRGCPFNCSYCLSSIEKRVRFFSVDRVKKDMDFFIGNNIPLVKFVDRTYNIDKKRYMEIWHYLLEKYTGKTRFHFEISVDLFDDEVITFIKTIPENYFQFEIGVQTTNEKTLKLIHRKNDMEKIKNNVTILKKYGNIHMHLDLIAGLPEENYDSFGNSFDFVYNLKPDMLQLGFLKILKGTEISEKQNEYGYKFLDYPPYEVLENNFMKYYEIIKIKNIEVILDNYYNSGRFSKSIDFIIREDYNKPFSFYEEFSEYWRKKSYFDISHKNLQLFNYFYNFISEKISKEKLLIFKEYLKFDYISLEKHGFYPEWIQRNTDKEKYGKLYEEIDYKGSMREFYKNTEYEIFEYNILEDKEEKVEILFRYSSKTEIKRV